MPGQAGTLEIIARQVGLAFATLEQKLASDNVIQLLSALGLQFPPQLLQPNFVSTLNAAATAVAGVGNTVTQLSTAIDADDEAGIVSAGSQLVGEITTVVSSLEQIGTELNNLSATLPGMNAAEVSAFAQNLPSTLLGYVLISYLENLQPSVVGIGNLLGIFDYIQNPGLTGDPTHPAYTTRKLQLSRLGDLISNPAELWETLYQWGSASFDGTVLLPRLATSMQMMGISSAVSAAGPPASIDSSLIKFQANPGTNPPGLSATWVSDLEGGFDLTLPLSGAWSVHISATGNLDAGLTATMVPVADITLHPTAALNAQFECDLLASGADADHPLVIVGQTGSSCLQTDSFAFGVGVAISWNAGAGTASAQPQISAQLKGGKLVIDLSQADGFLSSIAGSSPIEAAFDLAASWQPDKGLRLQGAAELEISLPVHLSLGPINVPTIYLVGGIDSSGLSLELSLALNASLGPLTASVDRLGLVSHFGFPSSGGNLGPVDVQLAFKPPSGVGLSVNASIIQGGGYLYIDEANGEYDGILHLMIADFISVTAIGLIATKMPDGSNGFSLLIIITADFGAGFQLGFGFTLLAVGGLLGLNRSMLMQPLMDAVRTDAIESVMFPQNVIANAMRIISDLRSLFPPQDGTFLVGPMAKIGWGEPTLISLALGIIVEIPPGDIAILGVLKLALPANDVALILLQVNFAGALEIDKQRFYFYATLYDSHVLFITLEGSMGVLFAWGDNANFVVSIGGFHPQYNPPPLPFPTPTRIEIDIVNESFARVRCQGYFAVTSNTVQFGVNADLYFGFSALNIQGHAGFDALIQFSPFQFVVSFSVSFSVNIFGLGVWSIGMSLQVSGPSPWHFHGSASISFFFFSISIPVDFTFGSASNTMLPPVQVMPILAGEYAKVSNWTAIVPPGSNLFVSLRQLDPSDTSLVLHPVGKLKISQRAVPLDVTLDKVGNQQPRDANFFTLTMASAGLVVVEAAHEQFAVAQFENLSDAQKLSQQAYTPLDSGLELSSAGTLYGSATAVVRNVRYELTVIDIEARTSGRSFFPYSGALFKHLLGGSAVARSPLSSYLAGKMQPAQAKVSVNPESFAVANVADNTVFHPAASNFTSQLIANDYLAQAVATDPALHGALHVIPQFEVAA